MSDRIFEVLARVTLEGSRRRSDLEAAAKRVCKSKACDWLLLGCFWSVGLLTAMKMPSEASHRLFFNCLDVSGAARSG